MSIGVAVLILVLVICVPAVRDLVGWLFVLALWLGLIGIVSVGLWLFLHALTS